MAIDVPTLDAMLAVLRKHGASAFRSKDEDSFLEVILAPGDALEELTTDDEEEPDEAMADSSPYNQTGIGITFKSFQAEEAEARRTNKIIS